MKGLWICALVLCSSFAKHLHYEASSMDSEDKSLYNDSYSQDHSVHNDSSSEDHYVHNDSYSQDHSVHNDSSSEDHSVYNDSYSQDDADYDVLHSQFDSDENFEESQEADEEDDFEEAFEKYKRNLYDAADAYEQAGELGNHYSLRPAGIKFDPNMGIDPEEFKAKWKGNLMKQSFGHGLGTAKPGSMVGPFSDYEKMKILHLHNVYRTNYTFPSGNTEYMDYSDDLAIYAESVVLQCIYENIVIPSKNYSAPFGMNVFIGKDPDPSYFLWHWYNELEDFDFISWKCNREECGHMTQMLWATTLKVGCARQYCWPGEKVDTLILCLYYPPGNVINDIEHTPVRGYIIGRPCSLCTSGTGYCLDNMCVSKEDCKDTPTCKCNLECQNCGVKNHDNCTCSCAEGWDYADCSIPCKNDYDYCVDLADSYCDNLGEEGFTYCREKCGMCNVVTLLDNNTARCCQGIVCQNGQVLDVSKCECQLVCPNIYCYEASTLGAELFPPSAAPSELNLVSLRRNYVIGFMFFIAAVSSY